jgi:hypothetical protein
MGGTAGSPTSADINTILNLLFYPELHENEAQSNTQSTYKSKELLQYVLIL